MLTERQHKRFYFPAWNRAFQACWRCSKGRIIPNPDRTLRLIPTEPGTPMVDYLDQVERLAAEIGQRHHRAATTDDLRHACHQFAIGKDKSSWDLTNPELNRVVHLFRILADPNDRAALAAYLNPSQIDRRAHIWYLENKCQRPYVLRICQDEHGTTDYRNLPDDQLHNLVRTLKNRPHAWTKSRPQPQTEDDPY